jgi:hypothetical protein
MKFESPGKIEELKIPENAQRDFVDTAREFLEVLKPLGNDRYIEIEKIVKDVHAAIAAGDHRAFTESLYELENRVLLQDWSTPEKQMERGKLLLYRAELVRIANAYWESRARGLPKQNIAA